jgi:hypothetical protein
MKQQEFLDIDISSVEQVLELPLGSMCETVNYKRVLFSTNDVIKAFNYFKEEFSAQRSSILDPNSSPISNKRFNTKASLVLSYWNKTTKRKFQLSNSN